MIPASAQSSRSAKSWIGAVLSIAAVSVVLQVVLAQDSRPNKPSRMRGPRDATHLDVDVDSLRLRVDTPDGVLVIYDAALQDGDTTECFGYVAYWRPLDGGEVQVPNKVLENQGDLMAVVRSLQDQFGVDEEALADRDPRLREARRVRPSDGRERLQWQPATLERVAGIMGFDAEDIADDDGGVAAQCVPCADGPPPPSRCDPSHLIREGLDVVAVDCCPEGGGGDPPPCSGPCCYVSCNDGKECTEDRCSGGACYHSNLTGPCSDDQNPCTNDVCSAGVCTHPVLYPNLGSMPFLVEIPNGS